MNAVAPTQAAASPSVPAAQPAQAAERARPTETAAPNTAVAGASSPLEGYTLAQIPGLVTNPYHPPPPGSDDPHFGADLSDMLEGSQVAIAGRRVQASLTGIVSTIIRDRFPFGNAVIIETPLEALSPWLRAKLPALPPTPSAPIHTNLTCPAFTLFTAWDASRPSLYILYAHLQDGPTLQPGDVVTCGQPIGAVGKSGNALNPHLHFEARIGPAGARLDSLSHYSNTATVQEMGAYCAWSVSGQFPVVDPLVILSSQP